MNTKKSFFTLLILFISLNIFAKDISLEIAKAVALKFYNEKVVSATNVNPSYVFISKIQPINENATALMYVCNFSTGGFVIVSADDIAVPIVGYASSGEFDVDKISSNVSNFMGQYSSQIKIAREHTLIQDDNTKQLWSNLLSNETIFEKSLTRAVAPLMDNIHWDQGQYYNTLCPVDAAGPDGHAVTGCVATAMSMIMYYWRYPLTGNGTHSYTASGYPSSQQTANFGTTTYDWTGMQDEATSLNNASKAIPTLIYQAGVSVEMNYSATGSSASAMDAATALKTYFRYATDLSYKSRTTNTDTTVFKSSITASLDLKRPVLFSGSKADGTGGHAFVCDGYDGNGYLHFNFGWSGYANGYYFINKLTPAGDDFTSYQGAIVNIHPSTSATVYPYGCSGTKTLTDVSGSIDDGSGPANDYANNNNCKWLISPAGVASITLTFENFNTISGKDLVKVYDGSDETAPLLGTFSGSTIPSPVTSTGGSMFIVFTSDASGTAPGWFANYTSVMPIFCTSTGTTYITSSGAVSDGSGSAKYNNNTMCRYYISPSNATSLTLTFTSFNTESGKDLVKVYAQNPTSLLGTYSGASIPSPITSSTGAMLIIFSSDAQNVADGWAADYTSVTSGIEENSVLEGFVLYPNPVDDKLNVRFNMKEAHSLVLDVFNISGQKVQERKIENCIGEVNQTIDVSNLPSGVYSLNISSGKDVISKRFIVK